MSIEKSYNSWAEQYDTNESKTRDLDKKATIETLSKYAFDNVIELGCGTGKNTEWLITKAKSIMGLDFSEEMLNKARGKINFEKIKFLQTDLKEPWPVENNFADLITCSLTLEHIKNLNPIFNQAHLKLKTGGKFFISELHSARQYAESKAKYESESGIKELEVYIHHLSDYLSSAEKNSLKLIEIKEWFDNLTENEVPRLISFIFEK
jgi:ubiquinone/menaquinone biosynthesis C-methylase UbiE